MYKLIGADKREYGPVTADQLRQWIAEGRVNAQTPVQPEGSTEWKTIGELPEFSDALSQTSPHAEATPEEIAARDYQIEIGSCISRGWELLKANMGVLIGGTTLIILAQMALGVVPIVGSLAGLIVGGVLNGGVYWLYLRTLRGESGGVADAFAGFNRAFVKLMLGNVVVALLIGLLVAPGAVCMAIGVIAHAHHNAAGVPGIIVGTGLLVAALPFAIYLSICWIFTLPLIIDKLLDFGAAMKLSRQMVRKHWWTIFGLVFVNALVAGAGILACGIGLLFTVPIAIGSMVVAYEEIFGARPSPAA